MASLSIKLNELKQIGQDLKPFVERFQLIEALTAKNQVKGVC